MHKIKTLIFIKLLLLIGAIILAGFLIFLPASPAPVEESTIIIMDVSSGMMIQDISTNKGDFITRLDAEKKIVTKIVSEFSQRSFGLITYGPTIDYLIPPTLDSGTLLQYATNLIAQSGGVNTRNAGLIAALQNKNIIVLGNVSLPKSLIKNAQAISLNTYNNPSINFSTFQYSNISTVQTQWLIIILCLLVILSI